MKIISLIILLALTGCIETAETQRDQEEKVMLRKQVASIQKNTADSGSRFMETEETLRKVEGRVEIMERQLSALSKSQSDLQQKSAHNAEQDVQIQALKEEIAQLKQSLQNMTQVLTAQAQHAAPTNEADVLATANQKFKAASYQEAIVLYSQFRTQNPKNKLQPFATMRIAESFAELGMKAEAQAFYDELKTKYPNSKEAKESAKVKKAPAQKKK